MGTGMVISVQRASAKTATAASRLPRTENPILSAALTLRGGGLLPVGVEVGPTGVLVGLGVVVMGVSPWRSVVGGGVMVSVAVVTVVLWNPVVVWLFGGGIVYVVVVVTGGGLWMLRVHGQLVMVIVVGLVTV